MDGGGIMKKSEYEAIMKELMSHRWKFYDEKIVPVCEIEKILKGYIED
jgi:hypothetical protein